jgi:hypothetical protein
MKVDFDRLKHTDAGYNLTPSSQMREWIDGRVTKVVVGAGRVDERQGHSRG